MRITLDVELQESDLHHAPYIKQALEGFGSNVETRVSTDKTALAERLSEAIEQKKFEQIVVEFLERLSRPELATDALDVLCSTVLFNSSRLEKGKTIEIFMTVINRLPEPSKESIKSEIVQRAMCFLSTPRRLDCSRIPLLPYAETLAVMTKMELLNVRGVLGAICAMVELNATRTAGMTCLGKLVEIAFDVLVRRCEGSPLESLRSTVASVQENDIFLYDVEYIVEAFGWLSNKPLLAIVQSGKHHANPILSLAYCGSNGLGTREAVVTSSVDGTIGTWDGVGVLTENIMLSRHYASALDLANRGHTLIVGTVGRNSGTPPAVVLYSEESNTRESRWEENGAVEPKFARFITCVRSISVAASLRYCVGVGAFGYNPVILYDSTQHVQEYRDHSDIVTSMHIPSDRDNLVFTGSRDCTILVFDLRTRRAVQRLGTHTNTVSAIDSCGDYIFSGGLDKRVVATDLRVPTNNISAREMDSAVLSLSVNSSMQCAISTLTGLYVANSGSVLHPSISRASAGSVPPRYNAVAWNSSDSLLYAGGESATLDIFSRTFREADSFDAV